MNKPVKKPVNKQWKSLVNKIATLCGVGYRQRFSQLQLAETDPRQYVWEELTEFTALNNTASSKKGK